MDYLEDVSIQKIILNNQMTAHFESHYVDNKDFVRTPLLVSRGKNSYDLIDGHRRLTSLKKLGIRTTSILCFEKPMNCVQIIETILQWNAHSMNFLDWLQLFRTINQKKILTDCVQFKLFEKYGQYSVEDFSKKHLFFLVHLPQSLFDKCLDTQFKAIHICLIHKYFKKDLEQWMELFFLLRTNKNELRVLLQYLEDIICRDSLSINELWHVLEVSKLLLDEMTSRERYVLFFKKVYRMRYPFRYECEQKIEKLMRSLESVKDFSLRLPQNLEGDCLSLTMRLRNENNVKEAINWMKKNENTINKLFTWI